jgi:hypothetical protein
LTFDDLNPNNLRKTEELMGKGVRVLICGVIVIMVAIVVAVVQFYMGSTETNTYLVGGLGGAAGVLVWQLTARKTP